MKLDATPLKQAGRAWPSSDLDLVIDPGRRLTLDEIAALAEAFGESDLPYPVDVVELARHRRALQTHDHGRARRVG